MAKKSFTASFALCDKKGKMTGSYYSTVVADCGEEAVDLLTQRIIEQYPRKYKDEEQISCVSVFEGAHLSKG